MPAERYFIEETLVPGSSYKMTGSEFHHLAHVMRTKKGETIEVVNGRGLLADAVVEHFGKDHANLVIHGCLKDEGMHPPRLILAQAIPKPNRLDFILEKGTELGVDQFCLFPGHGSVKKEIFPHQIERMRHLTIAAMKQCGRLDLPTLEFKPPLGEWSFAQEFLLYFGDVEPKAPPFEALMQEICDAKVPVLFFTGPESGFNDAEVDALKRLGAKGVKLHNNILRTDTASLVALSLISHWLLNA